MLAWRQKDDHHHLAHRVDDLASGPDALLPDRPAGEHARLVSWDSSDGSMHHAQLTMSMPKPLANGLSARCMLCKSESAVAADECDKCASQAVSAGRTRELCTAALEVSGRQEPDEAARSQCNGREVCQQQGRQPHAFPSIRSACKTGRCRVVVHAMRDAVTDTESF